MTWNYRIIEFETHLALHEVFYDASRRPTSYTREAISFVADPEEGASGIVAALEMALRDARHRPVMRSTEIVAGE